MQITLRNTLLLLPPPQRRRSFVPTYWTMKGTPPGDCQERLLVKLAEVERSILSG
jgi:hypothetical protein